MAFALIAAPEPASWALSGAGLLVLLAAPRRRARPLPARPGTRARSR
ncbi:PEP-CTERM sorting domain-containing protein [Massilia sp. KIM]